MYILLLVNKTAVTIQGEISLKIEAVAFGIGMRLARFAHIFLFKLLKTCEL